MCIIIFTCAPSAYRITSTKTNMNASTNNKMYVGIVVVILWVRNDKRFVLFDSFYSSTHIRTRTHIYTRNQTRTRIQSFFLGPDSDTKQRHCHRHRHRQCLCHTSPACGRWGWCCCWCCLPLPLLLLLLLASASTEAEADADAEAVFIALQFPKRFPSDFSLDLRTTRWWRRL